MSYRVKYQFSFISTNNVDTDIFILKKGYAGDIITRSLGRSPILKREKSGSILGTSLELYAECLEDGEFTGLYTSSADEYKVEVYRDRTLIWVGFVTPELYSEPDIAPPYDVQIIATDGLGELKNYDLPTYEREVSFLGHISRLLKFTGLEMNKRILSKLKYDGGQGEDFDVAKGGLDFTLDLKNTTGNCYDALKDLLNSLHLCITQHNGEWLLLRETDLMSYVNDSMLVWEFGSVNNSNVWPIGSLSTAIEPAKKSIVLTADYQYKDSVLINSDMDSDEGWFLSPDSSYDVTENAYYLPNKGSYINQNVHFDDAVTFPLKLAVKARPRLNPLDAESGATYSNILKLQVNIERIDNNGDTWIFTDFDDLGFGWTLEGSSMTGTIPFIEFDSVDVDATEDNATIKELNLFLSSKNEVRQINILLENLDGADPAYIYACYLSRAEGYKGSQVEVRMNNGARGEAEEVDLLIADNGRLKMGSSNFQDGVPVNFHTGNQIKNFESKRIAACGYMEFIGQDYALSVVAPRQKMKGVLNIPYSAYLPLLLTRDNTYYLLEKYDFDLWNDELSVEMISIPTSGIVIEKLTVSDTSYGSTQIGMSSGASSGGSSSSGGGGGSSVNVDDAMSDYSDNPVKNSVIKAYVDAADEKVKKYNKNYTIETRAEVLTLAQGYATTAENDAIDQSRMYTDSTVASAKSSVIATANAYTDVSVGEAITELQSYADTVANNAKISAQNAAQIYTNAQKEDAIKQSKQYTDTTRQSIMNAVVAKEELSQEVSDIEKSIAAAEKAAKDYTDEGKTALQKSIDALEDAKANIKDVYDKTTIDGKINEVEAEANKNAKAYADAAKNAAEATANAYADGIVDEAEQNAINTANAALDAAKSELDKSIENVNTLAQAAQKDATTAINDAAIAQAAAVLAQAKADSADATAQSAKAILDELTSDGVITPFEYEFFFTELKNVDYDRHRIQLDVERYGLDDSAEYASYVQFAEFYFADLLEINGNEHNLPMPVPSGLIWHRNAYYGSRGAILDLIAATAKAEVENAQSTADNANALASAAQKAATQASNAVAELNDDQYVTLTEKRSLRTIAKKISSYEGTSLPYLGTGTYTGEIHDWISVTEQKKDNAVTTLVQNAYSAASAVILWLYGPMGLSSDATTDVSAIGNVRDILETRLTAYYTAINVLVNSVPVSDYEYLKAALGNTASLDVEGVVLSQVMGVKDKENEVRAILNGSELGIDDTHGKLMLAAGIPDDARILSEKLPEATTKIFEDGHVYSKSMHLQKGCTIGNAIKIQDDGIKIDTPADGIVGMDETFGFVTENKSMSAHLGGFACNNSMLEIYTKDAMYNMACPAEPTPITVASTTNAIVCFSGMMAGLRPRTKVITVAGTSTSPNRLTELDFSVLVPATSGEYYLALPDVPLDGQEYWLETFGADVHVSSKKQMWSHSAGKYETSHEFASRGTIRFKYYAEAGIWTYTWVESI